VLRLKWRGRANCCKRLTKRRLFARTAIAVLAQSALDRRRGSRSSACKMGENRAAVSVAVFSRFAIYANVVSPTDHYTSRNITVHRSRVFAPGDGVALKSVGVADISVRGVRETSLVR